MITYHIISGEIHNVYSLGSTEKVNYLEFLESLENRDKNRFMVLVAQLADKGQIHDIKKLRKLRANVYELKTPNAKRLYFFWSKNKYLNGAVIISHGTEKLKKKELNKEIDKVVKMAKDFSSCTPDIRYISQEEE